MLPFFFFFFLSSVYSGTDWQGREDAVHALRRIDLARGGEIGPIREVFYFLFRFLLPLAQPDRESP